jgi:hypothetical protein
MNVLRMWEVLVILRKICRLDMKKLRWQQGFSGAGGGCRFSVAAAIFPLSRDFPAPPRQRRDPTSGADRALDGATAGFAPAATPRSVERSYGLLARGAEGLDATRAEVERLGGRALAIPTDVVDPIQVEAAFGPIDLWINNAMVSAGATSPRTAPRQGPGSRGRA